MYILYEESGQFKIATILTDNDSTLQIETLQGKRHKIKQNTVLLRFEDTAPHHLMDRAQALVPDIDVPFLWEMAPREPFQAPQCSQDYFGNQPTVAQTVAMLLCLHQNPIYFHRKGKGFFQAAPDDILQAALLAQAKKQEREAQIALWSQTMADGQLPADLTDALPQCLIQPDKNSLLWKAVEQALEKTQLPLPDLLLKLGVFPHELALLRYRFFQQYFPKGTAHKEHPLPPLPPLPQATVQAYSIDDISTTEIDDALAVHHVRDDVYTFSVHIACPALAVSRDSDLDKVARQRMSTLYCPGEKVPMQQDSLIAQFSLNEGKFSPALSLYVTADLTTGDILEERSALEQVFVQANLRSNHLEALLTPEALNDPEQTVPYADFFRPLWRFTQQQQHIRELARGKPEGPSRIEYTLSLEGAPDDPNASLIATPRQRHSPLDRMVSEMMILCNHRWAKLLDDCGLPGIFRSQQYGRVKMSTHAQPHDTIGVSHYAWTTSPLRRYTDLFNQRQLIAAVKHGVSARLVAPFKPKDADIFSIMSRFDMLHNAYQTHQRDMERYWCLRQLQQQGATSVIAYVQREQLVRIKDLPLTLTVADLPSTLPPQTPVCLQLGAFDLLRGDVHCRFVKVLTPEDEVEP